MIKEQGELLQEEVKELCKKNGIIKSFGYYVDKLNRAMLSYNGLSDDELMYMISQLVIRIAAKHKASPDEVLKMLSDGIKEEFGQKTEPPKN